MLYMFKVPFFLGHGDDKAASMFCIWLLTDTCCLFMIVIFSQRICFVQREHINCLNE